MPFVSVAIIRVLWDELKMSPRAGEKNVCEFIFFESDEARVDIQVASVGDFDAHGR